MLRTFIILFLFTTPGLAQTTYTLVDLEALVAEGNQAEFFDHALDIRPSERQEAWKNMVVKMGDVLSLFITQKPVITEEDFLKIEQLYTWNALKTDDVFRLRRQEIGLRYLKTCLRKDHPCWDKVKHFWETDKSDADTAYKLAELINNLENSPITVWSLLEVSLKSPLSEFYCKKDFVMNALWGKIEIEYIKLGTHGDLMKKIDETIHPDCVPILVSEANKRLMNPPKVLDRELSFQILKSQMKANQEVTDFFYTVYLLDTPSQGELFNYSWNRIKELGGESSRRSAVLEKLKKLDPLPDTILSSLDETKKKVILKHFNTYFPEYFNHYADQCTEFYGGKRNFPAGNPTIHCQDLMKNEVAPQILDDYKIRKYQEARKI